MGLSLMALILGVPVLVLALVFAGRGLGWIVSLFKAVGAGQVTLTCPHCGQETSPAQGRCTACGQEL